MQLVSFIQPFTFENYTNSNQINQQLEIILSSLFEEPT